MTATKISSATGPQDDDAALGAPDKTMRRNAAAVNDGPVSASSVACERNSPVSMRTDTLQGTRLGLQVAVVALAAASILPSAAWADGGAGGDAYFPVITTDGGAGGSGMAASGADGSTSGDGRTGSGGGGGAAGGGLGGAGGSGSASGAGGGAGGSGPGANGQAGGSGPAGSLSAGGGGGGAGGSNGTLSNPNGGEGGRGGDAGQTNDADHLAGGGGGGEGGYGLVLNGGTYTNAVTVHGGTGGNGGDGSIGGFGGTGYGLPGAGGDGGIGIYATGPATIINTDTGTIQGGYGGQGGGIIFGQGTAGAGAAAIVGADLTVVTSGYISSGLNGDGNGGGGIPAIIFTGGTNRLELRSGYSFGYGGIDAAEVRGGTGTLALGGNTDSSFDTQLIGLGFKNFSAFEKTGTSTWTLTGTTAELTPWTISEGTLAISSDGSLGDTNGALTLAGGTLETTASFTMARNVMLDGGGAIQTDPGVVTTVNGVLGDGNNGPGSLTKTGTGTLVLTGTNTYTGGTTIKNGVLSVSSDANLGAASAALTFDGGTLQVNGTTFNSAARSIIWGNDGGGFDIADANNVFTVTQNLAGAGGLTKTGPGTLVLSGTNAYSGATMVNGGTLAAGAMNAFSAASAHNLAVGAILDLGGFSQTIGSLSGQGGTIQSTGGSAVLTVNQDADGLYVGSILNNTGDVELVKNGNAALTLTGVNSVSAVTVNSGLLKADSALAIGDGSATLTVNGGTLDIVQHDDTVAALSGSGGVITTSAAAGASLTVKQNADTAFVGVIQNDAGSLSLTKSGTGKLTLNGVNTYTGLTTVSGGTLIVGDDSHAAASLAGGVTVNAGGTLGGIGTVGETTIMAGGIHTPGNSPGTQTINGNYANHGTLVVDVTPTLSDRLVVNGAVDISGATLSLLLSPTSAANWNINNGPFTIIANDGGDAVTGTFNPVTKNLLFLDETLDYAGGDGNDVTLELTRNDVDFADVGLTRNQKATAVGIDSLGSGNPLWNAVALQSDEGATRAAFDQVSGEIHASLKGVLIDDSRLVREAATNRIRSAFGAVGAEATPVLAYGEEGTDSRATGAIDAALAPATTEHLAVWASGFGSWDRFDSDGNAARIKGTTGGMLFGADAPVGENWRLGLVGGYSHTSFDVDDRASSGDARNWHLGVYGGGQWGALGLRAGAAYTWHDISTGRSVAFPGFADSVTGDYDAGTAQVFGELGYGLKAGNIGFEPFANLSYVSLHTDGFTEKGGAAALTGTGQTTDVTFTTIGLHLSSDFDLGSMAAMARGTLGWRHAFGVVTPLSTFALAGGDAFTIAGAPIARDAFVLDAGLDFAVSRNATLGISYGGQFSGHTIDQSVQGNLAVKF